MRAYRVSVRIPFFRLCCTLCIAAAVLSADAKKHNDEERPEWIAQPKSSDLMYLYVVGHAAGQPSETDAQDAAYRNALQKIAAQIPMPGGKPVPPTSIQRAEVVPGCRYVEEAGSGYEAWVQVSYPAAEKQKLIRQLEKDVKPPSNNAAAAQDAAGSSAPANSPSGNPSPASSAERSRQSGVGNLPEGERGASESSAAPGKGPDGAGAGSADTGGVKDNPAAQENKFPYGGQAAAERAKAGGSERSGGSLQFAKASEPEAPGALAFARASGGSAAKTITYSGKAEADGRSAELTLIFRDGQVSGRLQARGESGSNIRLTSTDVSFPPVGLHGRPWEDRDTTIQANWTGGDYGNNGQVMQDYPTNGTLTITLAEREGREVVFLHRITTSRYGYVFPLKGKVYDPGLSSEGATNTQGNGAGDPVGAWTGELKPKTAAESLVLSYEMTFLANGNVSLITKSSTSTESTTLQGVWRSINQGVEIQWSKDSLGKWNMDDKTAKARFNGPDCLIFDTGDGPITFSRKGKKGEGEGMVDGSSGTNPFDGKLKEPAICANIRNRERWKQAQEFLPENYSLSDNEADLFNSVIHVNVKQKETVSVANGSLFDIKTGKPVSGNFTPSGPPHFVADPSRVFKASEVGTTGIEVEGVGKGVGKLCVQMDMTVTTRDGKRGYSSFYGVFVVVVHEKVEPENPQVEIPKVEMVGQAVRKENRSPVANAIVSLVYIAKSGELLGYGPNPSPMTDAEGKFRVNVGNLPKGRFEVRVQLLGQAAGSDEAGIGVENDLWPFEKNVVDLTPELAERSPLNVGVIVLERVKWINNFDNRPVHVITPTGR